MKYLIIEGSSVRSLEEKIGWKLSEGWNLAGGVAVRYSDTAIKYFQAVWK